MRWMTIARSFLSSRHSRKRGALALCTARTFYAIAVKWDITPLGVASSAQSHIYQSESTVKGLSM